MIEAAGPEQVAAGPSEFGRAAARWVYPVVLPVLVAVLPGLSAWWWAHQAGRAGQLAPWLCPPVVLWLVGLLWARQVLAAASDELVRRVQERRLPEPLGLTMGRTLTCSTYLLVLLLPLTLSPVQQGAERRALRHSSGPALQALTGSFESHRAAWWSAVGAARAFRPSEPEFDPRGFRGPFAPSSQGAIGKVAFDEAGRGFYILDRQPGAGPGLLARLKAVGHALQHRLLGRSSEPGGGWSYERGLVFLPPGSPPPAETVWGVPMVRVNPLRPGVGWYIAARPEDPTD